MTILQLKNNFSSSGHTITQKSGTPGWYSEDATTFQNLLKDRSKWWADDKADLLYSIVNDIGFIEYGVNRKDFASIRVTWEKITWDNEKLNEDGSVTADVTVTVGFFGGYPTEFAATGYNVVNGLKFNNKDIATRTGKTTDVFFIDPNPKTIKVTTTIPPQSTSDDMNLEYYSTYPNHEVKDATIGIGFALYNPTPATYIPFASRKSGAWKSLNDNKGHIMIRKSGAWVDKSKEEVTTSKQAEKGHNRIRKSGAWLQAPKM